MLSKPAVSQKGMAMEYAYIVGKTDGKFVLVKQNEARLDLREIQAVLDGYLECVAPIGFAYTEWEDVRMLVDDNGLWKNKSLNMVASVLYGCGQAIVGDVVFVQMVEDDDGADVYAMELARAKRLLKWLNDVAGNKPRKTRKTAF